MKRFLTLVAVVALAACGTIPGPARGAITKKVYDDPDDWTTTVWLCGAYDSKGYCEFSYPVTTDHHDGPHWNLYVDNGHREGWREVPETIYNACIQGRWCDVRTGEVIPR